MGLLEIVDAAVGLAEIDKALEESPEVNIAVMERAEEARAWWIEYWESFDHPYSKEHTLQSGYVEQPGDYSKSIKIKFGRTEEGHPKARVTAHDYKATWIEYGSSHMPEFAPRAATISHFGGQGKEIGA